MNDEMVMGQRGGTKGKPRYWENAENFWSTFFYTSRETVSRICASKTRRNLQTFGWCLQFKQSCPWATLSYFCLRNKAGKINAMGRVVLRKMFQKSSALSILFEMRRSPLQIELATFAAKKTRPLCEIWIEKGIGWKGNLWPQAYNAKYNAQGRGVWE